MTTVRAFWHDENGATSIEYALIGTIISIVIISSLLTIGTKLAAKFAPISSNLT